jgi:hypothetical protein
MVGERHGMCKSVFKTAGDRHGICESAFMVTFTYSEYVIMIAFPWQQWMHERSSNSVIRTLPGPFTSI